MKCLKYNHSISQLRMKTTTCANVIVVFFLNTTMVNVLVRQLEPTIEMLDRLVEDKEVKCFTYRP